MNWGYVLSNAGTRDAAETTEPAMDAEAFQGFYERSARPLWAYLARASGDATLAEDLMQESYVRFLCASFAGDGEIAARRYLFRIASNLLRDHWRRRGALPLEDVPERFLMRPDGLAEMEARSMLEPALAQMRPRDRQLLWLAHAESYSHKEIAEITGLGVTSIRILLFRARRQMATLLKKEARVGRMA